MNAPTPMPHAPNPSGPRRRDLVVAAACGAVVAAMTGMAFAAVPLYSWFCRATGFAGTTQVASAGPGHMLDRQIEVRFDANVTGGLPWRFEPEQNAVTMRIGQVVTVYYTVTNESAHETAGQASYNVWPPSTGAYFSKINCFCFTEQRLMPHESREMPVVFFVDPEIAKDSENDGVATITLSYTMYPVRASEPQRLGSAEGLRSGTAAR